MNRLIIKDKRKLFLPSFSGFWDNSYPEGVNCISSFCHTHMLIDSEEQENVYRLHWVASVHDDNAGKVLWEPL